MNTDDNTNSRTPESEKDLTLVTILLSEARRLQEGHLPVCVQVLLVSTQDDDDVGAGQGPCVCQPVGQGIVRLPTVGQDRANSKVTLSPRK